MAAPNIAGLTSILGKTAVLNITTVASDIVVNAAASNKVLKINSLYVSNIDGASPADITASVYRGGVEYKIGHTISVPADATIVLISKDGSIYLEEGDSLRLTASADGDLQGVCSYEEIQ